MAADQGRRGFRFGEQGRRLRDVSEGREERGPRGRESERRDHCVQGGVEAGLRAVGERPEVRAFLKESGQRVKVARRGPQAPAQNQAADRCGASTFSEAHARGEEESEAVDEEIVFALVEETGCR